MIPIPRPIRERRNGVLKAKPNQNLIRWDNAFAGCDRRAKQSVRTALVATEDTLFDIEERLSTPIALLLISSFWPRVIRR